MMKKIILSVSVTVQILTLLSLFILRKYIFFSEVSKFMVLYRHKQCYGFIKDWVDLRLVLGMAADQLDFMQADSIHGCIPTLVCQSVARSQVGTFFLFNHLFFFKNTQCKGC